VTKIFFYEIRQDHSITCQFIEYHAIFKLNHNKSHF